MYALILVAAAAGSEPLESVIVTATRTEIRQDEALSSVAVVTEAELRMRPAAELGDALRFVPGVEVARLGGPGQQTSLFLRGTESNHVLVLMDGLRINPGTIGTAAIQNIAPEFAERVEVVKGPRSTLYGSDAIGGVVNVITRDESGDSSLQAGYGSFDTTTASFSAGFGGESAGGRIAAAWEDSAGFPTRTADTIDRGYENTSFAASGHAAAGAVGLGLKAWYASGTAEYSDFFVAPVDQDFENAALALSAEFEPTTSWSSHLMLGHAIDDLDQNQSTDFLDTKRDTIDWQNDLSLADRNTLTAGVLWQDEEADSISFGVPYGAATTTTQVYLQDQASFDAVHAVAGLAYTDHETFGSHFTGNLDVGIEAGADGLLTMSAGTGFRAPDATDRFGFGGNPDLDPEESTSYEIAYRQAIGERQSISVAAFRNDIDDLIDFVVTDPDTFEGENRNVGKARIDGYEAAWRYENAIWFASLGATWQDPRDRATNERLLRRARENYTARLARRFGPHEIAFDALFVGERRDFGFPSQTVLPAYWLANLAASIALGDRFTLVLRAENLLDENYEPASGYNGMGQSFFGALRYEFR